MAFNLEARQKYSLEVKERLTEQRIQQWWDHHHGEVYVSFSGGWDSNVLLHIARRLIPRMKAVFCDTGLEYPEIRDFVKTIDNADWIKPKLNFKQVIEKYGYPVISKEVSQKIYEIRASKKEKHIRRCLYGSAKGNGKMAEKWRYLLDAPFAISHKCCEVLKKRPFKLYERMTGRKPIIGMMAEESNLRAITYRARGCNAFSNKRPTSNPMMFWLKSDTKAYVKKYNLPYSKIYDMGYDRTGCMFCMFGAHFADDRRFKLMKETHPAQYKYCMNKLGCRGVMNYVRDHSNEDESFSLRDTEQALFDKIEKEAL